MRVHDARVAGVVEMSISREVQCDQEVSVGTLSTSTRGREVGGNGRKWEWAAVLVGTALMAGGIVLARSETRCPEGQDCGGSPGGGAILGGYGFLLAIGGALALGIDHLRAGTTVSSAVVGGTTTREMVACGDEPAAHARVQLFLPTGPVEATSDAAGRVALRVDAAAFGPRRGPVQVPFAVDGELVGELRFTVSP